MPVIMFTADEVFGSTIESMRRDAKEIEELSDLDKKPLDPGESPDARRHKIAKLGKRLAETFLAFDELMNAEVRNHAEAAPVPPAAPGSSRAN